jgi:peptide/nickel transport system permease protein
LPERVPRPTPTLNEIDTPVASIQNGRVIFSLSFSSRSFDEDEVSVVMRFLSYLFRRFVGIAAVLVGVSIVIFIISHVIPADPALVALGDHATQEQVVAFRAEYGLDKPLVEQYLIYVNGLFHGDMGKSIRTLRPVADDLRDFVPATIELALAALILSLVIGLPVGIWSSLWRDRLPDHVVRLFSILGASLPIFWLGLVLIGIFYYQLNWLPMGGRIDQFLQPPRTITGLYVVDSILTGNLDTLINSLVHLILPAFALGYYSAAVIARMTRSSMLEVLGQDYLRTARAKGLVERMVILRHALRNAMLPTLTIIGTTFGNLLGGAVLTETVFNWSGLGRYVTQSAVFLDFPAVMGVTLLAAVVYAITNLIVDLFYFVLDPRLQYG